MEIIIKVRQYKKTHFERRRISTEGIIISLVPDEKLINLDFECATDKIHIKAFLGRLKRRTSQKRRMVIMIYYKEKYNNTQ